ncbi:MAG: S-layer homology domain-containing protein [Oscillospiraceae bacterium]|nr:S-layer homology domain-containing protein [Oscillospiraceae bacterium]
MKRLTLLVLSAALVFSLCVAGVRADSLPAELNNCCTAEEWQILRLVNEQRLEQGLVPYSLFPDLQTAAHTRKQELVTLYSHTRPNGQPWHTAITEAGVGYQTAAENIAAGQPSPETVVSAWLNSEGHRENILDPTLTHAGLGHINEGFLGTSWVNLFMADNCDISGIELSRSSTACPSDGSIRDLDIYIKATCTKHGSCYLPLLEGMCSDFDPNGTNQTVTVTYAGKTAELRLVSEQTLDTSGADSWAVNWLTRADELGLLSQRNRANFTADITRLQFADLAVCLAQQLTGAAISPAPADTFGDTTEEVILKAKAAGIASGYAVETGFEFRPEHPITRQEICVMLSNVITYVENNTAPTELDRSESFRTSFPDASDVADWAVRPVALMCNNGVMSGRTQGDAVFLTPLAHTTLQEGVTLAVKLHDLLT